MHLLSEGIHALSPQMGGGDHKITENKPTYLNGHLRIRDSIWTLCQKVHPPPTEPFLKASLLSIINLY